MSIAREECENGAAVFDSVSGDLALSCEGFINWNVRKRMKELLTSEDRVKF